MTEEFVDGPTSRVLRMRGHDVDWVPVHVTVNQVELEPDTFAGLVSLRLPTDDEVVAAEVIISGAAITNDIPHTPTGVSRPGGRPAQVIVEPCGNTQIVSPITAAQMEFPPDLVPLWPTGGGA